MSEFKRSEELRKSRFYHRCFSGMDRGGPFRFVTLTSSPKSPQDIHRSFVKLKLRIRRRGQPFEYICVKEFTKKGRPHLHLIFRGTYLQQAWLSHQWQQCHRARVVDIRKVKGSGGANPRMAHELAKYLAKEGFTRFWWSWSWIYRGWKQTWKYLCRRWWDHYPQLPWGVIQDLWKRHLQDEKVMLGPTTILPPATILAKAYQDMRNAS